MNVAEFKELVIATFNRIDEKEDFYAVGLRYERKERQIGEVCEYSRNNIDREDERDFPEYGTAEYDESEEMDGTSAWCKDAAIKDLESYPQDWDISQILDDKHAYIIVSNKLGWEQTNGIIDDGELVMKDAVVYDVLATSLMHVPSPSDYGYTQNSLGN